MPATSRTEAAPSNPGRATQSASGDRLVASCHSRGYASIAVCHMSYLLCPDTLLCAPKTQRHEQRYDRNMGRRRRRYGPDTPTKCARLHTCVGPPRTHETLALETTHVFHQAPTRRGPSWQLSYYLLATAISFEPARAAHPVRRDSNPVSYKTWQHGNTYEGKYAIDDATSLLTTA